MRRIGLACLVFLVGVLGIRAEEPSKMSVKTRAKEMVNATLAGEWAKLIDSTYPAAVKELGGRAKAIETIETTMKKIQDMGFAIKKFEVGDPGDFHTEGDNTFVVVPTTMELKFPAGKILTKGYLLGISPDGGKSWTFVDGAGLQNQQFREKILPKMPAKLTLPEPAKPEIIKD